MTHLQLRRKPGERVLPVFYSANYLSLVPDETRAVQIEASLEGLRHESALVVADGWNISVEPSSAAGIAIAQNVETQVESWPATGLPFATTGLR